MFTGPKASLAQILISRDRRASRQQQWIETYRAPLISFTINMVGDVKLNNASKVACAIGSSAILETCLHERMFLSQTEKYESITGPEMLAAVKTQDIEQLKRLMVAIEDEHPQGRLFDIDVIACNRQPMSRDDLNLPRRKCLICEQDANVCARNRTHNIEELQTKMSEMFYEIHRFG